MNVDYRHHTVFLKVCESEHSQVIGGGGWHGVRDWWRVEAYAFGQVERGVPVQPSLGHLLVCCLFRVRQGGCVDSQPFRRAVERDLIPPEPYPRVDLALVGGRFDQQSGAVA